MANHANVWSHVESLSTALDGDRAKSEATLDKLLIELQNRPYSVRDELRRQMILIVAALSRLEVRMIESDGPLAV